MRHGRSLMLALDQQSRTTTVAVAGSYARLSRASGSQKMVMSSLLAEKADWLLGGGCKGDVELEHARQTAGPGGGLRAGEPT